MRTSYSQLSSKSQVTMPAWVKKALGVKANVTVVWLELNPGEISILAKDDSKKSVAERLCGIMKTKDSEKTGAVESLFIDRKNDLVLEERGFLK